MLYYKIYNQEQQSVTVDVGVYQMAWMTPTKKSVNQNSIAINLYRWKIWPVVKDTSLDNSKTVQTPQS